MPGKYLVDLVHSIGASRKLLSKAHDDGALIEGLCLYVSTIDALLRLGILYTRTQTAPEQTYQVPKALIRQDDGEKTLAEREVYEVAVKEGVISTELHDRLQEMYGFRNKVVHRFNISGVTYSQIAEACTKFEVAYQDVMRLIDVLENGPHGLRPQSEEERAESLQRITKKIQGEM